MEPIVRQVLDLNMRYYKALGLATLEYLQGLASFVGRNVRDAAAAAAPQPHVHTAPPPPPTTAATAIVLEAAAGERAESAFAVANHLGRTVAATFDLSPFRDENGVTTPIAIVVEPARVSLEPGQQAVVRIAATIGEDLRAGATYNGSVSVPNLSDRPVPIIVRRIATETVKRKRARTAAVPAADARRPAARARRSGNSRRGRQRSGDE